MALNDIYIGRVENPVDPDVRKFMKLFLYHFQIRGTPFSKIMMSGLALGNLFRGTVRLLVPSSVTLTSKTQLYCSQMQCAFFVTSDLFSHQYIFQFYFISIYEKALCGTVRHCAALCGTVRHCAFSYYRRSLIKDRNI